MATPEVKVKISVDGKEYESQLQQAEKATEGFAGKAIAAIKGLAALAAGAAVAQFFKSAVEEAANAEVQMGRLGTAVRNAGGNFEQLKPQLEDTVASVMRMSTATDDDLREALTRMISVSGDTAGSMKNLSVVADLAAYKNISVADAADIVAKAMNGNTTALNKMGIAGKDSATVMDNLRATVSGFAQNEANTFSGSLKQIVNYWGEFQEAVGNAILGTGEVGGVAQGLVGILADMASWVEENSASIGVFVDALTAAASGVLATAGALWDTFGPAITFIAKLLGLGLVVTLEHVTLGLRTFGEMARFGVGLALTAFGWFGEKAGGILKKFGIDLGNSATNLKHFGQSLMDNATIGIEGARQAYATGMARIGDVINGTEKQVAATHETHEKGRTRVTKEELDKQAAAEKAAAAARVATIEEAMRILKEANKHSVYAMAELNGYWEGLDERAKQAASSIKIAASDQAKLTDFTKSTAEAQRKAAEEAKEHQASVQKTVQSTVALARSAIDVGVSMGVISEKAAQALNSVLSMAEGLAKLAGPNKIEGVIQIVGSLANLIGGLGTSALEKKRQAAFDLNTAAMERLAREVGNINLRESGKTFTAVQGAVDAAVQARADARSKGFGPGDADEAAKREFLRQLRSAGVGLDEARALFRELFGRDMSMANAGLFMQDLNAFQQGLGQTEFGQFGKDFEGQLDAITKGFDIMGVEDADAKLKDFVELVGKFSPALAKALNVNLSTPQGLATATANLQALFGKLKSGGLKPEEIGVSGQQFLALIQTILPLLAAADGQMPGNVPGGSSGATSRLYTGLPDSVLGLGNGSSVGGVDPSLGNADAGTVGSVGTLPAAGTIFQGDFVVNQTFPNVRTVEDVKEIADAVNEVLRRDYNRLQWAQGVL